MCKNEVFFLLYLFVCILDVLFYEFRDEWGFTE